MTHHVILTRRAERELEDAADWWAAHRSPDQAARWYAGLSSAIASLAENPERCPVAAENGLFPYEIRELHYGLGSRPTHRAIFTVRSDMVLVLRNATPVKQFPYPEKMEILTPKVRPRNLICIKSRLERFPLIVLPQGRLCGLTSQGLSTPGFAERSCRS